MQWPNAAIYATLYTYHLTPWVRGASEVVSLDCLKGLILALMVWYIDPQIL